LLITAAIERQMGAWKSQYSMMVTGASAGPKT